MYFGSVRFFKHLILSTIALLIIVPFTIAIVMSIKNSSLKKQLKQEKDLCEQTIWQLSESKKAQSDLELELEMDKTIIAEKTEKTEAPLNDFIAIDGDPIDYQKLFPEMRAEVVKQKDEGDKKVVYLTFDDGPSQKTLEILDLLDSYGIKATFFVVYKDDEFSNSVYKKIVEKGHTIGVHSASHDYKKIYSSVEAYMTDFNKLYEHIIKVTGQKPTLFRFPGGSINSYNSGIYMEIIAEMTRRGFVYHDWNVSAQDASDKATEKTIFNMVAGAASKRNKSIVLMHDSASRAATVKALPQIIDDLYAKGYSFNKLDATVSPFLFSYNKPL